MEQTLKVSDLKFPEMRADLVSNLNEIISLDQYEETDLRAREALEHMVHYFYDDTDLASEPEEYLGLVLVSTKEVELLRELGRALEFYLSKYSPNDEPLRLVLGSDYFRLQSWAKKTLKTVGG